MSASLMGRIEVRPLVPARVNDYLRFFDTKAFADNRNWSRCYCYFPYHDPAAKDWDRRSAVDNREAMRAFIANGRAQGYMAYVSEEVIGWCNAAPRALYPATREDSEPDAEHTGSIMCFIVAPPHRGQGVAAALLGAACDGLKAQGMRRVEARPSKEARGSSENYPGPLAMYLSAGFSIAREETAGIVLVRKSLI